IFTPWMDSRFETMRTSLMSGTDRSTLGASPSSAATIAFETRFFAPRTVISPSRGRPPRTWNVELMVSLPSRVGRRRRPSLTGSPYRSDLLAPRQVAASVRVRGPRREGLRHPGGAGGLEVGDVLLVAEGQADVVEPLHQAPARVVVDLEAEG